MIIGHLVQFRFNFSDENFEHKLIQFIGKREKEKENEFFNDFWHIQIVVEQPQLVSLASQGWSSSFFSYFRVFVRVSIIKWKTLFCGFKKFECTLFSFFFLSSSLVGIYVMQFTSKAKSKILEIVWSLFASVRNVRTEFHMIMFFRCYC